MVGRTPQAHWTSHPLAIFVTILLIVSLLETSIMFLLPLLLPTAGKAGQTVADVLMLALFSAPFIWLLIVRPLRRAAQHELNLMEMTLDHIVDAVFNFDRRGTITTANPAAEKMFGYTAREMIGRNIGTMMHELAPTGGTAPGADDVTLPRPTFETVGWRRDGTSFPVEVSLSTLQWNGQLLLIAIVHDISERKRLETLKSEQQEFVENLLHNSVAPTFVLSPTHQVLLWNRACEQLTGIAAAEMLGTTEPWKAFYRAKRPVLADLVIDATLEESYRAFATFSKSDIIPEGLRSEGWFHNLNGRDRYVSYNAAPIRTSSGKLLAVIETLEDITARKQYEEQLEYQANHDSLTGLPNRNLLADRIQQAMHLARRDQLQLAVMFIDLDQFKFINDSLGHEAGDILLNLIGNRLTGCVRAGDTVAHHGGDEFVVTVSGLAEADDAAKIADKIQATINRPLVINEHELVVTGSIGISIFPKDGEDVQTLIKNADVAMYRAKEQGRNTFQFYTSELNVRSLARMTMEKHLRRALERSELLLYYQPKVNLHTGRITGMEALVRWQSPELGLVSPVQFIPLAEETGLIEPIGEWVLRTACAQNKAWQEAGLSPLTVAVNLSARQFRQANIASLISQVLLETGLNPCYLEIELTESLVMHNVDRVTTILNELKLMGISLAMDDFGTGYSSLSYLKRFPFDRLKVDQSFVRDIIWSPDSAAIAKTVIAMAHALRLKVIAEGVETESQLNYLRAQHCDEIQGYYFSRPIPAVEFAALLREPRLLPLAPQKGGTTPPTILVVDDEKHVAAALRRALEFDGYHVVTTTSVREGFELLANHPVAVVLSDLRMPEMSGSEFLSRVRELYPHPVRILISGQADLAAVTEAINRGAIYKFLTKPWDDDHLRATVRQAVAHYGSLTEKS